MRVGVRFAGVLQGSVRGTLNVQALRNLGFRVCRVVRIVFCLCGLSGLYTTYY